MRTILLSGILIAFLLSTKAQSYKRIHAKAIVCDTHNDIISSCLEKGYSFDQDLTGKTHSDLNRMRKGGLDAQVFLFFVMESKKNPTSLLTGKLTHCMHGQNETQLK